MKSEAQRLIDEYDREAMRIMKSFISSYKDIEREENKAIFYLIACCVVLFVIALFFIL